MEPLGQVIRKRREALGMTQAAVSSAVGVAKSYLSMIENGKLDAPPSRGVLEGLERALGVTPGELTRAADWRSTPPPVREEIRRLSEEAERGRELAAWLRQTAAKTKSGGKDLDALYRSGQLGRRINAVLEEGAEAPRGRGAKDGAGASRPGGAAEGRGGEVPGAGAFPGVRYRVPLINRVAAGVPVEHTDLGFPGRPGGAADEHLDVPGVDDPDAFATRITGRSMEPRYVEGDVVVFSPRAKIVSGDDCFVRLEPDHESTFKRVYFEAPGADGGEMPGAPGTAGTAGGGGAGGLIRLQPLNPAFEARTVPREQVGGMYRAVCKFSRL